MFTCDACLLRAFRSLAIDARRSRSPVIASPSATVFRRNHATLHGIAKGHHRRLLWKALAKKKQIKPPTMKYSEAMTKADQKDIEARENNRLLLMNDAGKKALDKASKLEMQFLTDPLKLAQSVADKLRASQFDAAYNLVLTSEKGINGARIDNTVSWNHLIDWLMSQGFPTRAWKIFNEMKKRGHKPDAHTYTIMLRGYRENVKKPESVEQAVAVYNSIKAANSAVTPTIIHTNAILSVCARAHDLETMWSIAGNLAERGVGAPDHKTFTTILQAINGEARSRAVELSSQEENYDPQPIFEGAVSDGRRLWADIHRRWKRGLLQMDEALVCAMGRLLLLSAEARSHEDVLNLVQQCMNIPRLTKAGKEAHTDPDEDLINPGNAPEESPEDYDPSRIDVPAQLELSTKVHTVDGSVYAKPGQNTLSMLLETTKSSRQLAAGKHYWQLLTSPEGPYQVVPDSENITNYLRLLRASRASQAVLDLLLQPRPDHIQRKMMTRGTFIIAMSTCVRDKKNPNVFGTASRIFDLMQENDGGVSSTNREGRQLKFSPKVLIRYLELAIDTTKGLGGEPLKKTRDGDLDFERDMEKNHTFRALDKLRPEVLQVKQLLKLHVTELEHQAEVKARTRTVQKLLDKRKITPYVVDESMEDLVGFLRAVIGAYDKILRVNQILEDDGMGPLDKEILTECWTQKRNLTTFLSKVENVVNQPQSRQTPMEENNERPDRQFEDEPGDNLDLTTLSQRSKILNEIDRVREEKGKAVEERGLSRIQKRELAKEERIRAQFPVSVLRTKRVTGAGDHKRLRFAPVEEITKDAFPTRRPPPRNPLGKPGQKTSQHKQSRSDRDYEGWGGEFETLAREQGRGRQAGIVELGQ
ncbi:hypothetical protein LTR10_019997 [Elasticomyces elasticus]|uniref:Pentatricopeptide repeat protein n=1 Tax=Exophiala sideris TaxID=1016849 RepID=A0ABR0IYE7_9EURO|nr:hypothetical protein LTR10_019997 [Elasticomyces elasticus]KAK5022462.1 hypothetical protein LTS07_010122 [Exophiala sideris]KAK5027178.1 hypothetical protein LTR13_009573 [Exophiala sideris]KAK5051316.1 hypothetical protein LTR69_010342 [Exophiala sideris]KAK5177718.1 hypothetical protein LTR44_009693 [Eurotiomycetes sp. CCFEE 6388]